MECSHKKPVTRFDDLLITCDKRPFLVKVLSDAVQAGQVDDSQAKTFDMVEVEGETIWRFGIKSNL